MHKKRICIFIFGVISLSCLGAWIANGIDGENPAFQMSGILLMSVSPLLMTIIVKTVYREGWQDIGLRFGISKNKPWYLFSCLLPVMLISYVIGLSFFSSSVSLSESFVSDLPQIFLRSGGLFFAFLVTSIGEELGWRGYLESALARINKSVLLNHLIVGFVWFTWHLPLILLAGSFQVSFLELLMILFSTLGLAVVYGQLRILSETVWTCVILHACSNALIIGFGSSNSLITENESQYLISLSSFSVAVVSFWALMGLSMVVFSRTRVKPRKVS